MTTAYTNKHQGAADILAGAMGILERSGWTQGACYDRATGRYDLLGAIALASGCRKSFLLEPEFPLLKTPPGRRVCALHAWDTLDALLGVDPATWNDTEGRTAAEVLRALSQAADRLRIRATHPSAYGFRPFSL